MSFVRWATVGTALWGAIGALAVSAAEPKVVGGREEQTARAPKSATSKSDASKDEAGTTAPQKQGPGYRFALELDQDTRFQMADKLRDEVIEQLENDILPKFEKKDPERPDLMFQLSEYYWEKFKYLYAREEKANEARLREWDERRAKGQKVGEAPKADHTESEKFRARTMKLYEQILADHPDFHKTDAVLFALGSNLSDLSYIRQDKKLRAQAAKKYEQLIKRFPKSALAGDAHVQLGDFYFDTNQLEPATKSYQAALKSKVPKVYSYALYKLAWCDYNEGNLEGGLKKLHQVVDFAEGQGKKMVDLKNESLRDSVLFYAQLNRPEEGIAYLTRKAPVDRRARLIARLGEQLADAGQYDQSTKVFRALLKEDPMRPEAPNLQNGIVANFEKLRQRKQVKAEVKALAESYGPGSRWWAHHAKDKNTLREAFEVTEQATRQVVTEYHQEAQKTSQAETFRLARDLYKQYLDAFASAKEDEFVSDHAFNMRFYYAQILWGLEEWEASADAYDQVVAQRIPDRPEAKEISNPEYRKLAAYNAILAYDKLLKIERGQLEQRTLADDQRVRDDKSKGGMSQVAKLERKEVKNAKPQPLSKYEQKMVAACDAYTRLDAKLKEPKDEVDIRYQAAVIHYDRNQFDEAQKRFREIIAGWPEEKRSEQAADLTLFILEGLERWDELKSTSLEFYENKKLAKTGGEFHKRLATVVQNAHYKWIDEVVNKRQQDSAQAAAEFQRFAKLFPKAKTADRALAYAMVLLRDAHQYDKAIAAGEQVLADHPGSPVEPKVRFTLAALYEKVAEFEKAAKAYESFLSAQEKREAAIRELEKRVRAAKGDEELAELEDRLGLEKQLLDEASAWKADATYNAGVWFDGLGQTEKAIATFRAYQQRFADRKDVPELSLRIASLQERQKKWPEAVRTYQEFQRRWAGDKRVTPAQTYLASYRELQAWRELKNKAQVTRLEKELVSRWAKLPAKEKEDLQLLVAYAHARFLALEPAWTAYETIRLDRVQTLQRDLKAKQKKLAELEKGYAEVLKLGAGEHSIAAVIRLGQAYEDLARNILESPTPRGLDEEQEAMYRSELENLAHPLEDKALEAFESALAKSYELGLYGDWIAVAQDKVNAYKPGSYGNRRELPYEGTEFFATSQMVREPSGIEPPPGKGDEPQHKDEKAGAQAPAGVPTAANGGAL